ncbi:hypothetical protein C8Q76DRAFT_809377 [Earliella scabrosa]|nr:hypothetical protein C8Q76DRAFT_809377 [Earliella scabrosa]
MALGTFSLAATRSESDGVSPDIRRQFSTTLDPLSLPEDLREPRRSSGSATAIERPASAGPMQATLQAVAAATLSASLNADGCTPQTSFSSTSTVAQPPPGLGEKDKPLYDLEAASDGTVPSSDVPFVLKMRSWLSLVAVLLCGAATMEALLFSSQKHQGWLAAPWLLSGWGHLVTSSLPYALATVLSIVWGLIRSEVQRLQSFSSSIVDVQDQWWVNPATNVSRYTTLTDHAGDHFMDMVAFQGASGFATAQVLFDIGPAPFVTTDGYTVEMFELPTGSNGTLYTNVSGVFNQATCSSPTNFQMSRDRATLIWHNTVWFDECEFSWSVQNVSAALFGVDILSDTPGCNYSGIPLQHRPVVFWYFSFKSQAFLSAVQCTPKVHAGVLNVAVDLASHQTSRLSFDDSTTASIGDVQNQAYNGLFFNDGVLDPVASGRLQSIRQQLPSAVFQAAKAKDPNLGQTFVYYGFTEITSEVYNTYLSLIAKSLYFVDSEDSISVRVGENCLRLVLVPVAVHLLVLSMVVLACVTLAVGIEHWKIRGRFVIPPRFGTIATAAWLSRDPELQFALQQAYRSGDFVEPFKGYRFLLDDQTGRIVMKRIIVRHESASSSKSTDKSRPSSSWLTSITRRALALLGFKTPADSSNSLPLVGTATTD